MIEFLEEGEKPMGPTCDTVWLLFTALLKAMAKAKDRGRGKLVIRETPPGRDQDELFVLLDGATLLIFRLDISGITRFTTGIVEGTFFRFEEMEKLLKDLTILFQ